MNWPREGGSTNTPLWAQALSPLLPEEFLRDFWGQRYLFQPGHPGRFAGLLPWEELNAILDAHRLEPKRLALYREGKMLEKDRFLVTEDGELRINAAALSLSLADGATLVLNQIHEMAPAVRQLAQSFQDALGAQTTVNLYAGWKRQNGFDLHWDAQDTIILQVAGRKRWKVYEPTRPHPLREDVAPAAEPTGEPVWDGILPEGGLLYMPRGWWHVAFPLDEPSLHLTVTIVPPNGADLLRWHTKQLLHSELVRRNLPRFAGKEDLDAYASALRRLVAESLDGEAVRRFLEESEARLVRRTPILLPNAPAWSQSPLSPTSEVELVAEGGFSIAGQEAGNLQVTLLGKVWTCPAELESALGLLRRRGRCHVEELIARLPDDAHDDDLLLLLSRWALGGVLAVRQTHSSTAPASSGQPIGNGAYVAPEHLSHRQIGDALLIRNAETTQVFELNGPSAIIWNCLSAGCSEHETASAVCAEYEVDAGIALADVTRVAAEFIANGLLRQREGVSE